MAVTLPVLGGTVSGGSHTGGTTLPQVGHEDYSETLELWGNDVVMASGAVRTDLVQSERQAQV